MNDDVDVDVVDEGFLLFKCPFGQGQRGRTSMASQDTWKTFTFKQDNGVLIKNRMRESITHSTPSTPSREKKASAPKSPGKNKEDGNQWAIIAGGAIAAAATVIGRKRSKSPISTRNSTELTDDHSHLIHNHPDFDYSKPISRSDSLCRCSNSSAMDTSSGFIFTGGMPSPSHPHSSTKQLNNDPRHLSQQRNSYSHHQQSQSSSFHSNPAYSLQPSSPPSSSSPLYSPTYQTKFKFHPEFAHGREYHATIEEALRASCIFPEGSPVHEPDSCTDMAIDTRKIAGPSSPSFSSAPSPALSSFSISSYASPTKETIQKLRAQLKSRDELILDMQLQISEQEKALGKQMMRMAELERELHNAKVSHLDMASENLRLLNSTKQKERERGSSIDTYSLSLIIDQKEAAERERNEERERIKQREKEWEKERFKAKEREEMRNREREAEREKENQREQEREAEKEKERRREAEREMEKERERQREKERKREREREMERQRERDREKERMREMENEHEKEKERMKHDHYMEIKRLKEKISFLETAKIESAASLEGMMEKRALAMGRVKELEAKVTRFHTLLEEKEDQIRRMNEERIQFESILKELHAQLSEQARENSLIKNRSLRYSNLSEGSYSSSPSSNSSHNHVNLKPNPRPKSEEFEVSSSVPLWNLPARSERQNPDATRTQTGVKSPRPKDEESHPDPPIHSQSLSNSKTLPSISSSEFGELVNELRKHMKKEISSSIPPHQASSSLPSKELEEKKNLSHEAFSENGKIELEEFNDENQSSPFLNKVKVKTRSPSFKFGSELTRLEQVDDPRVKDDEDETFRIQSEAKHEEEVEDSSTPRLGPLLSISQLSSQNLSRDETSEDKSRLKGSLYFSDVEDETMDAEEQWKLLTQRIADEVMLSSPVKVHELSAKLERLAFAQREKEREMIERSNSFENQQGLDGETDEVDEVKEDVDSGTKSIFELLGKKGGDAKQNNDVDPKKESQWSNKNGVTQTERKLKVEMERQKTEVFDHEKDVNDDWASKGDNDLNLEESVNQRERLMDLKRRVDRLTHLAPITLEEEKAEDKVQDSRDFSFPGNDNPSEKCSSAMASIVNSSKLNNNAEEGNAKLNELNQLLNSFDFSSPYIPTSQKEEMRKMMSMMKSSKNTDISPHSPLLSPKSLVTSSSTPHLNTRQKQADENPRKENGLLPTSTPSPSVSFSSSSPSAITPASAVPAIAVTVSISSTPPSPLTSSTFTSLLPHQESIELSHPMPNKSDSRHPNLDSEIGKKNVSPPSLSPINSKNSTVSTFSNSHLSSLPETPLFHPSMPFTALPNVQLAPLNDKTLPPIKTGPPVQMAISDKDQINQAQGPSHSQSPNNRKERPRMDYSSRKSPFHSPSFSPPLLSPSLLSPPLSPHHPRDNSQPESFRGASPFVRRGIDHSPPILGSEAQASVRVDNLNTKSKALTQRESSGNRILPLDSDSETVGKGICQTNPEIEPKQSSVEGGFKDGNGLFRIHGQSLSRTYSDSLSLPSAVTFKEPSFKPKHERSSSETTLHSSDWENSSWTIKDEVARLEAELEAMDSQTEFGVMLNASPQRTLSPRRLDYGGQRSEEEDGEGEVPMCSNTFGSSSSSLSSPGLKSERKFNEGDEQSTGVFQRDTKKNFQEAFEETHGRDSEDDNSKNGESSDEVLNNMLDTMMDDVFQACSK